MRKLLGGAVALGFAAVGSLALAGPGSTQEDPGPTVREARVALSPGGVQINSVDNCSLEEGQDGALVWAVFEAGGYSWTTGGDDPALADVKDTGADGSWFVGFDNDDVGAGDLTGLWPDAGAAGGYEVYGPLPFTLDDVAYEWFGLCVPIPVLRAEITGLTYDSDYDIYVGDPGDPFTIGSIDPCPLTSVDDAAKWELYFITEEGELIWDGLPQGADLAEDGSWEASGALPPEVGFYAAFPWCGSGDVVTAWYDPLVIASGVVGEEPSPVPERPETPGPAKPIVDEPPFTG